MARILFVEDEADLRKLIGGALSEAGFEVALAADGAEAIEALRGSEFDVVVSDVSMPGGITGVDLAGHIATSHPHARVILVSGHALAQLPPIPRDVAFLPKPYLLPDLFALLPRPVR